ncbi:MAG: DUF1641 domain-containing protein [Polyangiales bacterium]
MVRATNDTDVQRGMAVMLELMRHVGRAAAIVKEKRDASPIAQKRAKLDGILGSKRSRVLGVERKVAPPTPVAPTPLTSAAPPVSACAVPTKGPAPVATTLDGVGFGADGHLADASTWTRELGEKLAALQGVAADRRALEPRRGRAARLWKRRRSRPTSDASRRSRASPRRTSTRSSWPRTHAREDRRPAEARRVPRHHRPDPSTEEPTP